MMLEIDDGDIIAAVGRRTYEKGVDIWANEAVLTVVASSDGSKIASKVQGSRDEPYTQTIHVTTRDSRRLRIAGTCSCPLNVNCKHVAAALLQYSEQVADGTIERVTVPAAPPPEPDTGAKPGAAAGGVPAPVLRAPRQMSAGVRDWLERIIAIAGAPEPAAPAATPQPATRQRQLVLVLDHALKPGEAAAWTVRVRPMTVALGKGGNFIDAKYYSPDQVNRTKEQRARYLTDDDISILRDLDWLMRNFGRWGAFDVPLESDATSQRVLATAAGSGRLRHGTVDGPLLRFGPSIRAEPRWQRTPQGEQRLTLVPVAPEAGAGAQADAAAGARLAAADGAAAAPPAAARFDCVLPLAPPLYVDIAAGTLGVIETGLAPELAAQIAAAPVIGAGEAPVVKEVMRRRLARRPTEQADKPGEAHPAGPPAAPATTEPGTAIVRSTSEAVQPLRPAALVPAGIEPESPAAPAMLLPLPEATDDVEVRVVVPTPRLDLLMTQARLKHAYQWYAKDQQRASFPLPIARLSFDYAGEIAQHHDASDMIERVVGDKLVLTRRDHKLETQAAERLARHGLKPAQGAVFEVRADHAPCFYHVPTGTEGTYDLLVKLDDPRQYLAFATEAVPALMGEGWQIVHSADYPYRLADGEATWWADTGEGSGIDWFSFEVGIEYEGHRINLVPQLAEMIATLPAELTELALAPAGDNPEHKAFLAFCSKLKLWHTLPDGRLLPLPGERLAPLLKSLIELVGPRAHAVVDGKVRLHRAETVALAQFAESAGLDVTWAASAEKLIALGKDLRRGRSLAPVTPPATFQASLRPYQADGLTWLDFLRGSGFGGVLADDMGLGKTVQALAFLAREKAEGRLDKPAIILAPTSVLPNWQAEAQRFAPELKVLALRGLDRRQLFDQIPSHDLILSTYPLLARDHEVLLAHEYHAAILDEAQAIKNPKANVSALAHRIVARHRLALTGTPLENNLGEVWSLFEFLSPGLLGDESTFRRTFRNPIEKHGDQAAQSFLTRRLKPFMLRRTKSEVAKELPPKTEIVERVRLEGPQRDLYETVRSLMHARVREEIQKKGIAKSHIVFLDALLKLRQICCDPRLLKMAQARKVRSSAKLERLMEMIPELVGEGRRILLFSQFTSMLALIEEELAKLKLPYVMLTGSTEDRATPVREFQAGKVPLFLLSLKAGGTGLNLTAADTVIHYDPWWNPAVENQATDRAYRIGQDKPVFVYKMIVEEGIEEAIELLKARKAALAEALFAGGSKTPLDLTENDISALFAPLGDSRQFRKAA